MVGCKLHAPPAPIAAWCALGATVFLFQLAHHTVNDGRCFITVHCCAFPSWNRPDPLYFLRFQPINYPTLQYAWYPDIPVGPARAFLGAITYRVGFASTLMTLLFSTGYFRYLPVTFGDK